MFHIKTNDSGETPGDHFEVSSNVILIIASDECVAISSKRKGEKSGANQ